MSLDWKSLLKMGSVTIGRDEQNLWQLLQPVNPAIDLGTLEMRITDLLNLRAKQFIEAKLTDEEIGLDLPDLNSEDHYQRWNSAYL